MREIRAVSTPHKSLVCCPIWLAGSPQKVALPPPKQKLRKRVREVGSGPPPKVGSLPVGGPSSPGLTPSAFPPRGIYICPHSSTCTPVFPYPLFHFEDLHEDLSTCRKSTANIMLLMLGSPSETSPLCSFRSFCEDSNILALPWMPELSPSQR